MRKLFLLVAVLALTLPANALAATKTINVYGAVFEPARVTVDAGDTVKWVNRDNAQHQIVANNGTFASPVLNPGRTYGHTFKSAGTFGYRDVMGKLKRGTVVVRGAPASVTLGAGTPIVMYGSQATLTGAVSNGEAGETVTISEQPAGQTSTKQLATVTTTTGGNFTYTVQPDRLTTYIAAWKNANSVTVTVQVRPKVTFAPFSRTKMFTKVVSGVSHANNFVYLQRLSSVGWVTLSKLRLGPLSGRIFKLPRLCGTVTYRIYLSADQAGTGYLDGWSGTQKTRYRTKCR
jgi:plastocyanin